MNNVTHKGFSVSANNMVSGLNVSAGARDTLGLLDTDRFGKRTLVRFDGCPTLNAETYSALAEKFGLEPRQ